jgi:hypothetical protein
MNLGFLSETVILIDKDFLQEEINQTLNFYKTLYPDRIFDKISLTTLLHRIALDARVHEPERKVDVIFAYTLSKPTLDLEYNLPINMLFDINDDGINIETEIGVFNVRAFFAESNESCSSHYLNLLKKINHNSQVSRIVMVADNTLLNYELKTMYKEEEKSLFLLKRYHNTEIDVPIRYIKIDYSIALSLGLSITEI